MTGENGEFPRSYDVAEVEHRWQQRWDEWGTYEIDDDDPRPPYYVLCMYPYPSGPAHQGHVRNYTFGDVLVRYRTMQGYAVLSPFGFDSFGLPAENAAIKSGGAPREHTEARIAELKASVLASARSTTGGARSAVTTRLHAVQPGDLHPPLRERASPTASPRPRSTGARDARPCSRTNRSSPTARASAPATSSNAASSSSGSSASRSTPTSCSTRSTTSTGPSG
jgi:hypothetical protein